MSIRTKIQLGRREVRWVILLVSALFAASDFALSAHRHLELLDESYLWYGVWRTSLGEVPIRDFQAYDPLRYYWGALFVWLFGDGIVAMRASSAVLKGVMLFVGLDVLRRRMTAWPLLVPVGLAMTAWAYHFGMAAGYLVSVAMVWAGAWLMENPTPRRHLAVGALVGVAAMVGRNHGLYGLAIILSVMLLAWIAGQREGAARNVAAFGAGVAAGFSPIVLVGALVPGFLPAYVDDLRVLLRSMSLAGGTNIARPVTWPWLLDLGAFTPAVAAREVVFSVLLVLLLAVPFGAVAHIVARRRAIWPAAAPAAASAAATLCYAHYCFSRADIAHLSGAMQPFLLLLCLLPFLAVTPGWRKGLGAFSGVVLSAALALMLAAHPTTANWLDRAAFEPVEVRGDTLWMNHQRAREIKGVRHFVQKWMRAGESVLFAPYMPGMYLVADKRAPVKTIYFLTRRREPTAEMIAALARNNTSAALVTQGALDGRKDLTFSSLYPDLERYLRQNFRESHGWAFGLPKYFRVFRRIPAGDQPSWR